MQWLDSVSLFLLFHWESSGFVILCIGPWQMMHGTAESGVWKVPLKSVPFTSEYSLCAIVLLELLRVDLPEISDLFAGVWQPVTL